MTEPICPICIQHDGKRPRLYPCTGCGRIDTIVIPEALYLLMPHLRSEIDAFKAHLLSDKFIGTELVCADCGGHIAGETSEAFTACAGCGGIMREQRKDWIATADVLRWLDGFSSLLDK